MILLFASCFTGCTIQEKQTQMLERATIQALPERIPAGKTGKVTIAVVPKSLDNPVFLDAKEEFERISREIGITLEWLAPMQSNAQEQGDIVRSLIVRGVDGIIISCIDPKAMQGVINEAVNAGIKVATFDSDSPGSKRLFYCGTDNFAAGKACGTALYNVLNARGMANEELNVLVMTGDPESFNLAERLRGFGETTKSYGLKLNYVDILACQDDINLAGELLEGSVRKTGEIDIFFSTGGWPLILPPESLPYFQRWCKDGGISIVVDTFYPMLVAAKKGMATVLVGQDFKKMGELSIRNLYSALNGEDIAESFIDTGLEYADDQNFDLLLQTKKPWDLK